MNFHKMWERVHILCLKQSDFEGSSQSFLIFLRVSESRTTGDIQDVLWYGS